MIVRACFKIKMKEGDGVVPRRPFRPRSSTSDTIPFADADSPTSYHKSSSLTRPQSCRFPLPLPPPPPTPPLAQFTNETTHFSIDTEDTTSLNNILDALDDLDDVSDDSSSEEETEDDILSPLPVFSSLKKSAIPITNGFTEMLCELDNINNSTKNSYINDKVSKIAMNIIVSLKYLTIF